MNDAAEYLQRHYDEAVFVYGPESEEAKRAEQLARTYFQRSAATDDSGTLSKLEHVA